MRRRSTLARAAGPTAQSAAARCRIRRAGSTGSTSHQPFATPARASPMAMRARNILYGPGRVNFRRLLAFQGVPHHARPASCNSGPGFFQFSSAPSVRNLPNAAIGAGNARNDRQHCRHAAPDSVWCEGPVLIGRPWSHADSPVGWIGRFAGLRTARRRRCGVRACGIRGMVARASSSQEQGTVVG